MERLIMRTLAGLVLTALILAVLTRGCSCRLRREEAKVEKTEQKQTEPAKHVSYGPSAKAPATAAEVDQKAFDAFNAIRKTGTPASFHVATGQAARQAEQNYQEREQAQFVEIRQKMALHELEQKAKALDNARKRADCLRGEIKSAEHRMQRKQLVINSIRSCSAPPHIMPAVRGKIEGETKLLEAMDEQKEGLEKELDKAVQKIHELEKLLEGGETVSHSFEGK
jgi:hypothetical protein